METKGWGVPAPKGLPLTCSTSAHVVLPGRAGEALWPGRNGGEAVLQDTTALAPLFAHLLQQTEAAG